MARHAEIVGAGIGGLAAGIALRQAGWSVQVLERADSVEDTGAGLSIWPNAVHSLRALGLGELADDEHAWTSDGALRRADASAITCFPESLEARYGAPLVAVHRGDLQVALADELGADSITFGAEVDETREQGTVRLTTGGEREADLVVGADGLRSTTRSLVLGAEEPRPSGIIAFRGVTSRAGAEIPAGEWWGAGSVAGLLPLSRDRVYWYLGFRGDAETGMKELASRSTEYAAPVPDLIAATPTPEVLRHELFDRPPAKRWSKGVVTLLGDAAHPMLPFLGQGACSALDDAVALGDAISQRGDDVSSALQLYEQARVKQAAKLVRGSSAAARLALAKSSIARAIRDGLIGALPAPVRLWQLDGIVGKA